MRQNQFQLHFNIHQVIPILEDFGFGNIAETMWVSLFLGRLQPSDNNRNLTSASASFQGLSNLLESRTNRLCNRIYSH